MEKTITVTLLMEQEDLDLWGDVAEVEVCYEMEGFKIYINDLTYKGKDIMYLEDLYSYQICEEIIAHQIAIDNARR